MVGKPVTSQARAGIALGGLGYEPSWSSIPFESYDGMTQLQFQESNAPYLRHGGEVPAYLPPGWRKVESKKPGKHLYVHVASGTISHVPVDIFDPKAGTWVEVDASKRDKKAPVALPPLPTRPAPAQASPAALPPPSGGSSGSLPVALLFPGQGSQYVKMMAGVKDLPAVKEMLETANKILDFDLLELCLKGPEAELERTKFCQPAMYVAGLAGMEKLRSTQPEKVDRRQAVAGLSLGEYTALTAAGVFDFETGLKVVKLRGEAMQSSVSFPAAFDMLHVWKASGEELAAISSKKLQTVRGLKNQLEGFCGLPRFRQRLLLDGDNLPDDMVLDFPSDRDLQLVMLGFVSTSQEQEEVMEAAIKDGSVAEVENLLQLPMDPNAGRFHSFLSSSIGSIEIMQLLLEAKADPNGGTRLPPLRHAILQHELEAVKCLLKAGASLEQGALTPLCFAALCGHSGVLRVLLVARANTEVRTYDGSTPLHLVTQNLRPKAAVDTATMLVEAGAIVDSQDKFGQAPLWLACSRGHMRVVRLFLKAGARTSIRDRRGETLFHAAGGRKHILRLLSNSKWSRAPHVKARSRQ
ncbi:Mcat [Symbiodinium sp. CCMP2592]|nr:Mcat [Symbiodinium sp. CCMP2592]